MSSGLGIATIELDGAPVAAVVLPGGVVPLSELVAEAPRDVTVLIEQWATWRAPVTEAATVHKATIDLAEVRWLPPLQPRKILCVGSNYYDHVAEMAGPAGLENRPAPFPFSFLKPGTALVGSGRTVTYPSYGKQLDWEAELAVVIGDPALATGPDPLAAVFGYTVLNDLSLRDFLPFPHTLGLDAVVSKGFDGAAPIGPWITTADAVGDPQHLPIKLHINGELQQDGSTADMIFGVADLVRHYARVMTLQPGDVIATGTPAGVGAGQRPPRFLNPGDVVRVRIGELGSLETTIGAPLAQEQLDLTPQPIRADEVVK
ncbi:fumarylacetoacetate hydrolase family protein [Amycolatopsis pithecellobii]|uniref:FAA hydrolase family protein n=1 Tax=Amycolatopsis pithecellobii TaxID=664692 RepID=A0A6N7Z4Y7_9PSEU|nr:fumarylacetoacetate hydrolase family protein [Amycolatopsis pithecellobii]MTD54386.1 FAA hydrolase family protein [Amycolatopsis pithecellobii]